MSWVFFAIATAVFAAAASLVQKKVLYKQHAMEFSATISAVNLLFSIPLFFFIDYSTISFQAIGLIFIASIAAAIGFLLVAKAVRHMEISASSPLRAAGVGITALMALFVLGEKLSSTQWLGIFVLIIGVYVLQTQAHHSLIEPFKIMRKSKYIHFIFIALLLYGGSSLIDRYVLTTTSTSPLTYIAFLHLFLAINFIIMHTVIYDGLKGMKHSLKSAGRWIILLSIFTIGYRYTQMEAISIAYVGLVLGIKRLSVLITTIGGGTFFHDHNLPRKITASLLIVGGAILVAL